MQGFGQFRWTKRDQNKKMVYKGYYEDNFKHGEGTLTWYIYKQKKPEVVTLKGNWEKGVRDGKSVLTWPNGKT